MAAAMPRASTPAAPRRRGPTPVRIGRESKGPEEPTQHVGLDAISAVSVARPLRAGDNIGGWQSPGQWDLSTRFEPDRVLVHGRSTNGLRRPQPVVRPVAGSRALTAPP